MSDETVTINGRAFRVVGQPRPPAPVPPGSAHSTHEPVAGRAGGRGTKYGNKVVTTADGERIDSRAEMRRWAVLQAMEHAGTIYDLVRQPVYCLAESVKIEGEDRARPAMKYTPDFSYVNNATRKVVVEDVKSPQTAKKADFRMRQHLMKLVHNIDVRIVK